MSKQHTLPAIRGKVGWFRNWLRAMDIIHDGTGYSPTLVEWADRIAPYTIQQQQTRNRRTS